MLRAVSNYGVMRRYRMLNGTFDTRVHFLTEEIKAEWEPRIRAQHWDNRLQVMNEVRLQFGEADLGQKLAEFGALGAEPFSVITYHNLFFRQVREAFVIGSHYPALVGCCALGERILNHLIRELRDDFKATPEYKRVYDKDSFDDWERAIDVLVAWDVLLPDVATKYRQLRAQRNQAIHFRPETSTHAREMALDAVQVLREIIEGQFGTHGTKPWYFHGAGETYLKGDSEAEPFVKRFLVPAGLLVGPKYTVVFDMERRQWKVEDIGDAGPAVGTDQEFLDLRRQPRATDGK